MAGPYAFFLAHHFQLKLMQQKHKSRVERYEVTFQITSIANI